LILISYQKSNNKVNWLRFFGYFAVGIAMGLKLTNASYVLALLAIEIFNWKGFLKFVGQSIANGLYALFGLLVSYGYWGYYLLTRFGSPLYPNFNAIFRSRYYPYINFNDSRFFPKNTMQAIFYPFYFAVKQKLTAEVNFRDIRLAGIYVFIILLVASSLFLYIKRRETLRIPRTSMILLVFIVISYLAWEYEFSIYRYLIPVEFLSMIAIVASIFALVRYQRIGISIIIISIIMFDTVPMNWGRIAWKPTFFGVSMPYKLNSNSMMIMAGSTPESYLIPYLPHNISVIRIFSSIDPNNQNFLIRNYLHERIGAAEKQKKSLYGIESLYQGMSEKNDYLSYGLELKSCLPIQTYKSKNLDPLFLCKLQID
jgi:hypothetical protein